MRIVETPFTGWPAFKIAGRPTRLSVIRPIFAFALLALAPLGALAAEQNFTKTISLRDRLDLSIASGAGTIRVSRGPAGRLTVSGHVRANDWHATDDRLRDIAANPPIQQDRTLDRTVVRIGSTEELAHVIIDYEIEAPPDCTIQAIAGAGDIFDDGVGENVRFSTGSGDIHAIGLNGHVAVSSNQGNIEVELSGQGEVSATSNSGNLELRDLRGALRAATGAGSIQVSGVPAGDWSVQTGKGNIELTLGKAACAIDAQAAAGLVHSDLHIEAASASGPHHLAGMINGGGHNVILQVGEGEIHIL